MTTRSGTVRFAFAAQRPSDALALGRSDSPALLLTCEGGESAAVVARGLGAKLIAVEDQTLSRRAWSNEDLSLVLERLPPRREDDPVQLLSYAMSPRAELAARRSGYSIAGPPGTLKEHLDRKDVARELFSRAGLETVPWRIGHRGELDFDELAGRFGVPVVLQLAIGSSGRGTHVVHTRNDLASLLEETDDGCEYLASPLIDDATTLNLHGLVTADRVEASIASVQLTGVDGLTGLPFGYCGNDFGAAAVLPPAILEQAGHHVEAVGIELQRLGWLGIFGVDILVSGDRVLPLEINPRFQGSSWLLAEVEEALCRTALGAAHRDLFLSAVPFRRERATPRIDAPAGGFLIFHQGGNARTFATTMITGIYGIHDDHLKFRRPGVGLLECELDEIYLEGLPPYGHIVEPDAVLARVASWRQLADPSGRLLTSWGAELARHVTHSLAPDQGL